MDQKVLHFTMKAALYGRIADGQEPQTKQANGFTDFLQQAPGKIQQWYQSQPADAQMALMGGLIGGGGGAALGGLSAMTRPKNKRHLLRDALIGGLSGGAVGAGAGYLGQRGGYMGGVDQDSAAHFNLVNNPSMKALQGAPAAALASMGGNPMAMMAASNAAMTPTTPSGNPVEQAYGQYLKGQSPEAAKAYFEHLGFEHLGQGQQGPEATKKLTELGAIQKLTEQYANEYGPGFFEEYPGLKKYWYLGVPPGAAAGAFSGLTEGTKAFRERARYLRNPLTGPAMDTYLANHKDEFKNYGVNAKHPRYSDVGDYNQVYHALKGAPGAPGPDSAMQDKAIASARANPYGENEVIRALEPDMESKTVSKEVPGKPAKPPSSLVDTHGRPIRPGTPEGKMRTVSETSSSWNGRWKRPEFGKGVKIVPNQSIISIVDNPEYTKPTFLRSFGRGGKGLARGGAAGLLGGLATGAVADLAGLVWPHISPHFRAPSTAPAQQ